jgi:hypothetical protein
VPYEAHDEFEPPAAQATIWRYLTLSKFLALMMDRQLFFPRADLLTDPLEGSFPISNPRLREAESKALLAKGELTEDVAKVLLDQLPLIHAGIRSRIAVSCWRIDEHESAAMWKLYTNESEGIAVKSTFERLIGSLANASQQIHVGIVKYIDYASAVMSEQNLLTPYVHKRKSFEYEQELRAVLMFGAPEDFQDLSRPMTVPGVAVPVDLELLVAEVVVSPAAGEWFVKLVTATMARFGLAVPVRQSDINSPAVW